MSESSHARPAAAQAWWWRPAVVAGIMVVLALVGVALATANARLARGYWVSLVPVYGVLCTLVAWKRSQQSGEQLVVRQLLHWLGIAGAVALDFYVPGIGLESQVSTGLDALLLLALGSYLAGVHLAWPFLGVGALLTLTLIVVAKAEQYLWLVLLVGAAAGALAYGLRRWRSSREGPPPLNRSGGATPPPGSARP
jgi:hypothetical protein